MEDFKRVTPLLDNWKIGELISETDVARVYTATCDVGGQESVAILKHIIVPSSETQVQALIFSGAVADEKEALYYYADIVRDLEDEIRMMHSMKDCPNILQYHGYQALQKESGIGFEVFLLMDYCETLQKFMKYSAMTHLRTLNLAIDICTALEVCREAGLIHRNIKPENIFISVYDQYMLGDLGVARTDKLQGSHVPDHLLSEYSAPELSSLIGEPSETIDTYSLGLVLYHIMNGGHSPFEDEQTSAAAARKLRESGEPLPSPLYADYEFGEIILKACSYDPADRYQSPTEMKKALTDYFMRNNVRDELIVPPLFIASDDEHESAAFFEDEETEVIERTVSDLSSIDEDFKSSFRPDLDSAPKTASPDTDIFDEPEKPNKSKKGIFVGLGILAVFLVAVIYFGNMLWPTVSIDYLEAEATGSTAIVVSWMHSGWETGAWKLECQDPYGNKKTYNAQTDGLIISDLTPSTQYTLTVKPDSAWLRYKGDNTVVIMTNSETSVTNLLAKPESATEVNVSWTVSGTAPDEWLLTYTVGGTEVTERVRGNSLKVNGLLPGTYYVFSLSTEYNTLISGALTTTCSTPWYTEINELQAVSVTPTSIDVSWKVGGEEPLSWTVSYRSQNGESGTRRVVGNSWTVDGLQPNTWYDFTLEPEGDFILGGTPIVTALTEKCELVTMEADVESPYSAVISWAIDGISPLEWTVNYGTPGGETSTVLVRGEELTLSLFPGTKYDVELIAPEDYAMTGIERKVSLTTDEAEEFDEYGVSNARISFYTPAQLALAAAGESATATTSFAVGSDVSFVATVNYEATDRTKFVETMFLIRNSAGAVVASVSSERTWDGSWTELNHSDTLTDLPEVPGDYTLEIYFNKKLLTKGNFKITG